MKVAIYKRVSSDGQVNNTSLEFQEEACRKYADQKDYKIVSVYEDKGVSAKTLKRRDSLIRLLEDSRKKKFDIVLVYKLNRLARNTKDAISILDDLLRSGCIIESSTEGFDVRSPSGQFIYTVLSAQAQMDNEVRGKRGKFFSPSSISVIV